MFDVEFWGVMFATKIEKYKHTYSKLINYGINNNNKLKCKINKTVLKLFGF